MKITIVTTREEGALTIDNDPAGERADAMSDRAQRAQEWAEDPFASLHDRIVFSSADWGRSKDLAWIYGIVVGWDDDPDDPPVLRVNAMDDLQREFGWTDAHVERLRRLHTAFLAAHAAAIRARAVPYDQGGTIGGPVAVTNTTGEPYVPDWLKGTFESARRKLCADPDCHDCSQGRPMVHEHCTCTFQTECCWCAGREH